MNNHSKHVFGKDHASTYDQRNHHLEPITTNIHYLIPIILSDLPSASKVLFVGSGTGTEIVALANAFPQFSFTAVEPSDAMAAVCLDRLEKQNLLNRCALVRGFVHDLPQLENFDAAVCLLVLHHTNEKERKDLIQGIYDRLKMSGYFVASELIYDFSKARPNDLMEKWKVLIGKTDVPKENLQRLPAMMKEHLSIQTPSDFESMVVTAGFQHPIQFFQTLLIRAWYMKKNSL